VQDPQELIAQLKKEVARLTKRVERLEDVLGRWTGTIIGLGEIFAASIPEPDVDPYLADFVHRAAKACG
jgi:hypothetical protein